MKRLLNRFRKRWYKAGHRPKPGTILYSPSLELQILAREAVAGMANAVRQAEARMRWPQITEEMREQWRKDTPGLDIWRVPDSHQWVRVDDGTALTGGVGFRFCTRCDREELDNGVVRLGINDSCGSVR